MSGLSQRSRRARICRRTASPRSRRAQIPQSPCKGNPKPEAFSPTARKNSLASWEPSPKVESSMWRGSSVRAGAQAADVGQALELAADALGGRRGGRCHRGHHRLGEVELVVAEALAVLFSKLAEEPLIGRQYDAIGGHDDGVL